MKRRIDRSDLFTATLVLLLVLGSAASSAAQVKRVRMHIGGYLCGN
jgi:hypothetical protein